MKKRLYIAIAFICAFVLWTLMISIIDVQPIGPNNTNVGFSTINRHFHNLTGVNFKLYTTTDWLGLIPVLIVFSFGFQGLAQWIKRKNLFRVDYSILTLGVYYFIVFAVYLIFETVIINYRPVLINGHLEVSYPSSTTMLVMCVMPTALIQFNKRIKSNKIKIFFSVVIYAFIEFMVVARLISGVHWFTDIIGGIILSTGLVILYSCFGKR